MRNDRDRATAAAPRTPSPDAVDDLVARFRSGDEEAGAELYRRFSGRLLLMVKRRLEGARCRGALDSEAILQEGFRSFFSAVKKPHFDPHKGNIGGLLSRIVLRKAQTRARRKYPEAATPEAMDGAGAMASLLSGQLSEQEVAAGVAEAVDSVLDRLTDRERLIMEAFLDEEAGRSIAEVARSCRRSVTTVEGVIDRFIRDLRALVAAVDQDGGPGP